MTAAHRSGYYEFNFSPAGDWAAYRFEDYRHGMTPGAAGRAPRPARALQRPRGWSCPRRSTLAGLPTLAAAARLRVALAAVIED